MFASKPPITFAYEGVKLRLNTCKAILNLSCLLGRFHRIEKKAGNRGRQHADEPDSENHESDGDQPALGRHGRDVSIAHRGRRDNRPPEGVAERGDRLILASFYRKDSDRAKADDNDRGQRNIVKTSLAERLACLSFAKTGPGITVANLSCLRRSTARFDSEHSHRV